MSLKRPGWPVVIAVAVMSVVLAGGGLALAVGTDSEGLVACARNKDGRMRLVDDPSDCRRRETAVSWNVAGPQGDPGVQGETGPQGADGGSCSVTDNGDETATMTCPDGTSVTWSTISDPDPVVGADCTPLNLVLAADLRNCDLSGADLFAVDLSFANLTGADLTVVELSEAELVAVKLTGAIMNAANLTRANLGCSGPRCADLEGAILSEANLSVADAVPT